MRTAPRVVAMRRPEQPLCPRRGPHRAEPAGWQGIARGQTQPLDRVAESPNVQRVHLFGYHAPSKWGSAVVNGDAEFDRAVWIRTYVKALRQLKPELRIDEAAQLGLEAFAREGRWQNPKVAAWGDALFGPLLVV